MTKHASNGTASENRKAAIAVPGHIPAIDLMAASPQVSKAKPARAKVKPEFLRIKNLAKIVAATSEPDGIAAPYPDVLRHGSESFHSFRQRSVVVITHLFTISE
jgi:hypothetical protein